MNKYTEYNKQRRHKAKTYCLELLGNKCVKCGSTEALEFDHIDPKTKVYSVATIFGCSKQKILEEVNKCQLLCRKCHIEKSKGEQTGRPRSTSDHGNISAYMNRKCRCEECKEFYSFYRKDYYKKNGWYTAEKEFPNHGTTYTYHKYKCRCEKCIDAYNLANTKSKIAMKAKRDKLKMNK